MTTQNEPAIDPRTAWDRYRPSAANPWDLKKAGHLHRRAAFGASTAELQATVRDGPDAAITTLLRGRPDADELWATLSRGTIQTNDGDQLPALWLYRMLYSAHPL